jgi:hypothetical protein
MMISITYIQYVFPTGGHLEQVSGRNPLYALDLRSNALIVLLIGYRVGKWRVRWERQKHRQEVVHSDSITSRSAVPCRKSNAVKPVVDAPALFVLFPAYDHW